MKQVDFVNFEGFEQPPFDKNKFHMDFKTIKVPTRELAEQAIEKEKAKGSTWESVMIMEVLR